MIYLSDWRYSTTVVGLIQYFNFYEIEYEIDEKHRIYGPCLYYRDKDIESKEMYLKFVEHYFEDLMYHRQVEKMLIQNREDKQFIRSVNKKLNATKASKSLFGDKGVVYNGTNNQEILDIIDKNRLILIEKRFANGKQMYARFAPDNKLFSQDLPYCRLNGYWLDQDRKTKSMGYMFNEKTCVLHDIKEFDFIPFAFEDGVFINNNFEIRTLLASKNDLRECVKKSGNYRSAFLNQLKNAAEYSLCDVEMIYAKFESERFETLYIREDLINVIDKIDVGFDDIANDVFDNIMNVEYLDGQIEQFLRLKRKKERVEKLIDINVCIGQVRRSFNMRDTTALDMAIKENRVNVKRAKCADTKLFIS